MFCIKCGKKLEDNVKFCPSCGTKIESKEEPKEEKIEEVEEVEEEKETAEEVVEEVKEEVEEVKEEPVEKPKPVPEFRREYNPPPVAQPMYNVPPKKSGSGAVVAILVILILLVIGGGTLILVGLGTGFIKISTEPGEVITPEPIVEPEPEKPEVHNVLTVNWKGYSFSIPEEYDFESEATYAAFGTSEILYQLSVHNLNYYEIKAAKENLLKTVELSENETLVISKVDVDRHDGKEYIEAYGESNTLIYHYYVTATDVNDEVVAIAVLYEKGSFTKSEVTPVITKVVGSLKRLSKNVEDSEGELTDEYDEISLLDDFEE